MNERYVRYKQAKKQSHGRKQNFDQFYKASLRKAGKMKGDEKGEREKDDSCGPLDEDEAMQPEPVENVLLSKKSSGDKATPRETLNGKKRDFDELMNVRTRFQINFMNSDCRTIIADLFGIL